MIFLLIYSICIYILLLTILAFFTHFSFVSMDILHTTLHDLGLSSTEIRIYLAGLGYTSIGVRELEKQTGIKRPTLYHALDTLGAKGLVASASAGGVRLTYTMTEPKKIERLLDKKLERLETERAALQTIIPLLQQRSTQTHSATETQVKRYTGIEGITTVIDEALYTPAKTWDIIAPQHNFFSDCPRSLTRYFMATRARRGITTRALWERSPNWKKLSPNEIKIRQPRFLPPQMTGHFRSLILIFDNKIAFIPSYEHLSAILIESTEIAVTMRGMFEALWLVSEEYTPKK